MKSILKLLIPCCLLLAGAAHAKDIRLLKITNHQDKMISYMKLMVDENNEITGFGQTRYLNGEIVNGVEFSIDPSDPGYVLEVQKGRKIVILRTPNLSTSYGGSLVIDFLYNGMTKSRRNFDMDLINIGGKWQIQKDGKTIEHIDFIMKKVLFKIVGIKKVKVIK